MPTARYIPTVSSGIQRWKPCVQVHATVPATPTIGVRVRKRMFTQSFVWLLMATPPLRFASITCIVLTVFAKSAAGEIDAAQLFRQAQALLFAGRAAEASPLFEKAAAKEPKVAAYHLWLARSYAAEAKTTSNVMRLLAIGWN